MEKLTPKYFRSIIRQELKHVPQSEFSPMSNIEAAKSVESITNNNNSLVSPCTAAMPTRLVETLEASSAPVIEPLSNQPSSPDLAQNLKHWAVECHVTQNVFNNLLNILKKVKDLKELTNLPSDCRTLLKTDTINNIVNTDSGHYYHFGLSLGLMYALENLIDPNDELQHAQVILFDINIDGLPLTKSSGSQLWPILGSLCSGGDPFIIGVWHGLKKPKFCNEILESFIKEYVDLKENGFFYKHQRKEISLSKIICDAPAKSFVLCVKGHNAYFGCTKCVIEGTHVNNRVCYTDLNSSLRTDNDFRSGRYDDYHTGRTPLLILDIDLIKNVTLDYMHLVCLGVMKRLLQFWLRGNMVIRMRAEDLDILNETILNVRNHISYRDFARLPRPLHDLDRWKATEYRQFLLYTGPILLKDRLKPSQYMHFLSLSCAIRILCSGVFCLNYNNYAKELLVYFVRNYSRLYGEEYVSHNVHNLIHLADDVLNFGSLENFSAFKYENYMYEIKKKIKSCKNPLQQLINRENESRYYQIKRYSALNPNTNIVLNYLTTYKEPLLNGSLVKAYKWVTFSHFKLGTDIKNNHCIIKGDVVIKILKIIQCQVSRTVFLVCQKYLLYENSFVEPCNSKLFYGGIVNNLSNLYEIVPIHEVVTKCIHYGNYVISYV